MLPRIGPPGIGPAQAVLEISAKRLQNRRASSGLAPCGYHQLAFYYSVLVSFARHAWETQTLYVCISHARHRSRSAVLSAPRKGNRTQPIDCRVQRRASRDGAGDFYREWAKGKDAPLLADGEKLSEENLNIVRKIAKLDPERGDELMNEMVREGLSTKELRKEWRELRDGDGPIKVTASSGSLAYTCGSRAAFDAVAAALKAAGIEFEPS